ncbi:hypothetical protein Spiro2_000205 [Spirobacillus cienkowskii]
MNNNYILCFVFLFLVGNLNYLLYLVFPTRYFLFYDFETNFILGFLIPIMFLLYCFLKIEFIKEHCFEIFVIFFEAIKKIIKCY